MSESIEDLKRLQERTEAFRMEQFPLTLQTGTIPMPDSVLWQEMFLARLRATFDIPVAAMGCGSRDCRVPQALSSGGRIATWWRDIRRELAKGSERSRHQDIPKGQREIP